jgi:hypothetical protein
MPRLSIRYVAISVTCVAFWVSSATIVYSERRIREYDEAVQRQRIDLNNAQQTLDYHLAQSRRYPDFIVKAREVAGNASNGIVIPPSVDHLRVIQLVAIPFLAGSLVAIYYCAKHARPTASTAMPDDDCKDV